MYNQTCTAYTWSNVIDMYRTITANDNYSLFTFEITFPVRLSLALQSFAQLHWLAKMSKSGLTFWSPVDEVHNTSENLARFMRYRSAFNHSLVYYDLPPPFDRWIEENFHRTLNHGPTTNERETVPSMKDHWHTTLGDEDNVLVSDYSAVITKSNVFLRTKQKLDATVACTWSGTIDFLLDAPSQAQAILCYLAETEHQLNAGKYLSSFLSIDPLSFRNENNHLKNGID